MNNREKGMVPVVIKYPFAWFQLTLLEYAASVPPSAFKPGATKSRYICVCPMGMSKKRPPATLKSVDEDILESEFLYF
jgi:hypothetical protein